MAKILVLLFPLAWIMMWSSCTGDSPSHLSECPFPQLNYKQVDITEDELIADFAADIKGEIVVLKSKISKGKISAKANSNIRSTVKRYAEKGLAADSIFVGYYNAYVLSACNRWAMYKENSTEENELALQSALSDIERFIAGYSDGNRQTSFRELEALKTELMNFAKKVESNHQFDAISKRNYLRKITHMEAKLSAVDLSEPEDGIIKVRSKFDLLVVDFDNRKKF